MAKEEKLEVMLVASHHFLCPGAGRCIEPSTKNQQTAPAVVDVYSDGEHKVSCTYYILGNCGLRGGNLECSYKTR